MVLKAPQCCQFKFKKMGDEYSQSKYNWLCGVTKMKVNRREENKQMEQ